MMTSSKPYLLRGLYEWLLDNDLTPHLLIDSGVKDVMLPENIALENGQVVLNLMPSAVKDLDISNEYISFSARFSGVAENVYCPMAAIMAIYSKENGQGMVFENEFPDPPEPPSESGSKTPDKSHKESRKKPSLKVVR